MGRFSDDETWSSPMSRNDVDGLRLMRIVIGAPFACGMIRALEDVDLGHLIKIGRRTGVTGPAELAPEPDPALNDAAEFQLKRDASIGTSRRGIALVSLSSASSSPPDELELDQYERGGASSFSAVGGWTACCGPAERRPGRANRGRGVATCAVARRARRGIGATTALGTTKVTCAGAGAIARALDRVRMCT